MTHKELVAVSCKFARKLGFPLVIPEAKSTVDEIPDVIAFRGGGDSLVIECKVSRSDFLADKEKPFRKEPYLGMGLYRIYVVTENVLKEGELDLLPEGWHLIVVDGKGKPVKGTLKNISNMALCIYRDPVTNMPILPFYDRNVYAENAVLYSYIRKNKLLK